MSINTHTESWDPFLRISDPNAVPDAIKLEASRSGASTPGSYEEIATMSRAESSTTIGDFDDATKQLSDDGNDSTTPSSWTQSDNPHLMVHPGKDLQAHCDYWTEALEDVPVLLNLPTDRFRSLHRSSVEARLSISLGTPMTQSLKKMVKEHDMDLGAILVAAWSAVLSRLSRQEDIIVGIRSTDLNHRDNNSQFDDNILPLRIDLSGDPNTTQLLERVRRATMSAKAHQELSLHRMTDAVKPTKEDSFNPLFQVVFQWHEQELLEMKPTQISSARETIDVDLKLHLQDSEKGIAGELRFATALFDVDTIKRHVGYLHVMLSSMVADAAQPVATVDIISPSERTFLQERWDETSVAYADYLCMHQLFEAQVKRTPNATAVVFEDRRLSYSELNVRANRLAHQLIELGVRPDARVAICVERSLAMITGVLAILKAGGAYVPLDPAYASERLRDILADAEPEIALVDKFGRTALGEVALASMTVLDPNIPFDFSTSNPRIPGLTSRHLAYIIYTSGSTGKPKGVIIEHRGVVNLAQAHTKFFDIDHDSRFLQFASINFDASVADIMLPLSSGAAIYLPPDSIRLDRNGLWEYMARHSVTHAALTPSFLQDGKDLPVSNTPLKLVLGGEPLGRTLLRNLVAQGYAIINDYGPTETTISAISWRCPQTFQDDVLPIGRPLDNVRVYLLDNSLYPVPLGTVGEMYIGGGSPY
ncbi:hypothetical protein BGZ65_002948 [Modicella reniformis]|uniref:Uncharacterized protein n=1 Tax=Modicella reniformis TaxID=1440133 RepID=A0A9P6MI97_9FUNG|nr:hypothetical protein BGZ65_002948 [Modicella reniformis]